MTWKLFAGTERKDEGLETGDDDDDGAGWFEFIANNELTESIAFVCDDIHNLENVSCNDLASLNADAFKCDVNQDFDNDSCNDLASPNVALLWRCDDIHDFENVSCSDFASLNVALVWRCDAIGSRFISKELPKSEKKGGKEGRELSPSLDTAKAAY